MDCLLDLDYHYMVLRRDYGNRFVITEFLQKALSIVVVSFYQGCVYDFGVGTHVLFYPVVYPVDGVGFRFSCRVWCPRSVGERVYDTVGG